MKAALKEKVIRKFDLDSSQKKIFISLCKRAQEALLLKGEHRFLIAEIALELHNQILGKKEPLDSPMARHLRGMFARDISFSTKAIDCWIDVKQYVVNQLPNELVKTHAYTTLYEASAIMKREKKPLYIALAEAKNNDSENERRKKLLLRYSAELLTSCRKFRGKSSETTEEVKYRLRECLKLLP